MRISSFDRKTLETDITCKINIDGTGKCNCNTGIGFLDHMLVLFSKHGSFDVDLLCKGDLNVDNHHSVEDIGIVLGNAFKTALDTKTGINRYGTFYCPMDESLSRVSIDLSGRGYLVYNVNITRDKVGDMETDAMKEFFYALAMNLGMNLHITNLYGENTHHIFESIFKSLSRALKEACSINEKNQDIPSTKGVL
ncbi:MAG: imidazoleglycerol-phosphate dehydratase HisB [Eubacteriaceae bacterium]